MRDRIAAVALRVALVLASACAATPASAQRVQPDPFAADIARFEAADRASPVEAGAILFIGSSSIRMWTDLAADFPARRVLNRGFGGSKIADVTRVVPRIVLPYRPREIVFYAGDNDLADGTAPTRVAANFAAFVDAVRARLPDERIVFVSIKPSPARANLLPAMRAANAAIRDYIATRAGLAYVDVFTPMLGKDGQPRGDLFGPDRLHMNRDGYRLWRGLIEPALD